MPNIYQEGLDRNVANYTPLTPLTFIARTAYVYPERMAVIHGQRRYTWLQTFSRARRLASALAAEGVGEGDTVAALLNNTPEMIECHFGVPVTRGGAQYAQHASRC
jgi:fatty-acyl-CoA synthase